MPKFAEQLKAKGLTDEEIASIQETLGTNPRAIAAFDGIVEESATRLSQAEKKFEDARIKKAEMDDFWAKEATPQINEAYSKVATAEARAAFYEQQAKTAKESGFIPADAPAAPTVVANANVVPGSPGPANGLTEDKVWSAMSNAGWAMSEYMRLYPGQPLPDDIDTLAREAVASRTPFRDHVSRKYDFEGRRKAATELRQKEHDDAIRKDEREVAMREFTEKAGSNPFTRTGGVSRFSKYEKAPDGSSADKLAWTKPDARDRLRARAHELVAKEQVQ